MSDKTGPRRTIIDGVPIVGGQHCETTALGVLLGRAGLNLRCDCVVVGGELHIGMSRSVLDDKESSIGKLTNGTRQLCVNSSQPSPACCTLTRPTPCSPSAGRPRVE